MPLRTFGSEVTTAQARARAERLRGDVREGLDPVMELRAIESETKAKATEQAFTFGVMVDAWVAARVGDRRESYLDEAQRCMRRNLPRWLDRPASSLTVAEAVRELDTIKRDKGTVTANRTLSYARAAFGWAVKRQAVAANPMAGIERPGREESRDRVLSDVEVRLIWTAAEALGPPYGGFVRLLLLTLARRDEVALMRWDELDNPADPKVWTLPASRSKNRRAYVTHLSAPARAVLQGAPVIQGCPYIFPSEGEARLQASATP
jgi:integrase